LSLVVAFKQRVDPALTDPTMTPMNFAIDEPIILAGLLVGAMMPNLFAALTMISVGKAAAEIILEVRRQFHGPNPVPGLYACILKATAGEEILEKDDVLPESDKCVAISTKSSVREMIAPGAYAILSPMIIGFLVGPRCLMGLLGGAIASGCMNAIMMSNAGGAWDNSKKLCEKLQLKKTQQGKACVVGDTVGDPFKDTSGPALNILIKLMSMVSLTMGPLIRGNDDWDNWWIGLIPLVLVFVISFILYKMGILGWSDPLGNTLGAPKDDEPKTPNASPRKKGATPESTNLLASTVGNTAAEFDVDDSVKVEHDGEQFDATITEVNHDGSYNIHYTEDSEAEEDVSPNRITANALDEIALDEDSEAEDSD